MTKSRSYGRLVFVVVLVTVFLVALELTSEAFRAFLVDHPLLTGVLAGGLLLAGAGLLLTEWLAGREVDRHQSISQEALKALRAPLYALDRAPTLEGDAAAAFARNASTALHVELTRWLPALLWDKNVTAVATTASQLCESLRHVADRPDHATERFEACCREASEILGEILDIVGSDVASGGILAPQGFPEWNLGEHGSGLVSATGSPPAVYMWRRTPADPTHQDGQFAINDPESACFQIYPDGGIEVYSSGERTEAEVVAIVRAADGRLGNEEEFEFR